MNIIIRFVIYILLFYVNIICYSYDCNKFNFFIKRNNYELPLSNYYNKTKPYKLSRVSIDKCYYK